MKKIVYLFLFISAFGFAQDKDKKKDKTEKKPKTEKKEEKKEDPNKQDNIIITKIRSPRMNAERTIKIYIPQSYDQEESIEKTYPLAVVFDSEFLFDIYVANAKLFAKRDKAPEQIVVGILQNQNEERYTDCDFSVDSGLPNKKSSKFYSFIKDELIVYMEDNYRISVFRTVVGNTLTANFTNYFLIEDNPVFNSYVNINPSYAPKMHEKLEEKTMSLHSNVFYYISTGNYNTDERKASITKTNNLLKLSDNEFLRYKYDDYSNASKTASIGQSIPSAMGFTFRLFAAISKKEFHLNVADLSPAAAIEYLEKKYVEIAYLYGDDIKIRERDIYRIEPIIIDKDNGDYLEEFGLMINRIYPESPLGDFYIGMYYEKGQSYKEALKHYKNGYAKEHKNDKDADAYYKNIERVIALQEQFDTLPEIDDAELLKEIEEEERIEEERLRKEQEERDKFLGK